VSPQSNPTSIASRKVGPNETKTFPLGPDPHIVCAYSGGVEYGLDPTDLSGQTTKLSTIWTPRQKKRNRPWVYGYMNQEGFFQKAQPDDSINQSIWKTTYATPNGKPYTTDLKFAEDSGSYDGGQGRLSEVTYQNEGGVTVIRGKWQHGQSGGPFQFFLTNGDKAFNSEPNGRRGAWWGIRAERPEDDG
jgi:hypothetical protein